jgi:AcrR family transcriptional regulator
MNTDALLDAAARLLDRGDDLSFSALAVEAGVARGTVYKRFASREALLAALAERGHTVRDTRERLLDAVGVVLRRDGLAALTLDAVAREAGLGAVTVYRRFKDREGLLRAFAAERSPRRLAAELGTTGEIESDLFRLARETLVFVRKHTEIFLLLVSNDPEARATFAEAREGSTSVRALTAALIDRSFPDPTGRTVAAFHGLVLMVALQARGDPDEDARFVVETFLRGVKR